MNPNKEPENELIRLCELIAWVNIPRHTIFRMVRKGIIKPVRPPGCYSFYRKSEIRRIFLVNGSRA